MKSSNMTPGQMQDLLQQSVGKNMTVNREDTVICSNCKCEYFTAASRFAKMKVDFKFDAIGMITEPPALFCVECKTPLPKTEKDLMTLKDITVEGDANA